MPVSRARRVDGFTLVELLVVMFIAGVVLAGVTTLMSTVLRQGTGIIARTDASQRGRLTLDRMTQQLRSQVCVDLTHDSAKAGLAAADRNSVRFYADLTDGSTEPPAMRELIYEPANQRVVQKVYPATSAMGAVPTTWSASPATSTLISGVTAPAGRGIFTFYKYDSADADREATVEIPGTTSLSADSRYDVARIDVTMDVAPGGAQGASPPVTRLQDGVVVRNLSTGYPSNAKELQCG